MCGIWAYVLDDSHSFSTEDVATHEKYISTLSKRGPDRYKDACYTRFRLAFHRLAINDTSPDGDQPFVVIDNDGNVIHYICNGEIYNYESNISFKLFFPKLSSNCFNNFALSTPSPFVEKPVSDITL